MNGLCATYHQEYANLQNLYGDESQTTIERGFDSESPPLYNKLRLGNKDIIVFQPKRYFETVEGVLKSYRVYSLEEYRKLREEEIYDQRIRDIDACTYPLELKKLKKELRDYEISKYPRCLQEFAQRVRVLSEWDSLSTLIQAIFVLTIYIPYKFTTISWFKGEAEAAERDNWTIEDYFDQDRRKRKIGG